MKHKPKSTHKMRAPRNPFVAAALFKKAGTHRKPEKALRRQEKVLIGSAAQRQSIRLLTDRFEFDSRRTHQNAFQSNQILKYVLSQSRFCIGFEALISN